MDFLNFIMKLKQQKKVPTQQAVASSDHVIDFWYPFSEPIEVFLFCYF